MFLWTRSWKAGPINKDLEKIPGRCIPLNIGFLHLDFHVISSVRTCEKTTSENWTWFLPVQAATTQLPLVPLEAELADAPWRGPMANQSDFFNFGLTEGEFKDRGTIRIHPELGPAADGRWFLAPRCSLLRGNLLRNPSGIDMNWHIDIFQFGTMMILIMEVLQANNIYPYRTSIDTCLLNNLSCWWQTRCWIRSRMLQAGRDCLVTQCFIAVSLLSILCLCFPCPWRHPLLPLQQMRFGVGLCESCRSWGCPCVGNVVALNLGCMLSCNEQHFAVCQFWFPWTLYSFVAFWAKLQWYLCMLVAVSNVFWLLSWVPSRNSNVNVLCYCCQTSVDDSGTVGLLHRWATKIPYILRWKVELEMPITSLHLSKRCLWNAADAGRKNCSCFAQWLRGMYYTHGHSHSYRPMDLIVMKSRMVGVCDEVYSTSLRSVELSQTELVLEKGWRFQGGMAVQAKPCKRWCLLRTITAE